MPIVNNLVYEPIISGLNSENDIILLLRNVRHNLGELCDGSLTNGTLKDFSKESLGEIVSVIDEGHYNISKDKTTDRVDLSKAHELLVQYRRLSEPGCQSCQHYETFMPEGEADTFKSYCGASETKEDLIKRIFMSQKIREHLEKGCDERVPVFRPLDEVLAEAD